MKEYLLGICNGIGFIIIGWAITGDISRAAIFTIGCCIALPAITEAVWAVGEKRERRLSRYRGCDYSEDLPPK